MGHKPANLSFAEASVITISAGTAVQALTDTGKVQPGRSVLITGASGGTAVFVGGESSGVITGMRRRVGGALLSSFIGRRLVLLLARERASDYERLVRLVESGQLMPALDRCYPLERAAYAVRRLDDGAIRGKVAMTM